MSNKKSFHPTGKTEHYIEQGSSALGSFFCIVFAAIVVIWLCRDTSANLDASIHHYNAHRDASTLALLLEWING